MKSSINCLLTGLASFDIILILTSILMFGIPSIYTHSLINGYKSVRVSFLDLNGFKSINDKEEL